MEKVDLSDFPYEIQKQVLSKLDEKDLIAMHEVSKSWKFMIVGYMNDKHSVKSKDWRWFCKHQPQIEKCSICLEKLRKKINSNEKDDVWYWWD